MHTLKRKTFIGLGLVTLVALALVIKANPVIAQASDQPVLLAADTTGKANDLGEVNLPDEGTDCGGINIGFDVNCTDKDNPIYAYVGGISKFLAVGVGVVLVLAFVISGFQYITAQDNPQQVSGAKNHIFNAIVGLIAYIFMFAILQWLVPGGVF